MLPRLLLTCLALTVLSATGCRLVGKKRAEPKDSGTIAGEVEESLKRRWVEKRTAELVAQGKTAETAKELALQEFREKFEYTGAAKK